MSGIDIFAWIVFVVILLSAVVVFVALAQMPGKTARERNHPQAEAINIASWLGLLLTMGVVWVTAMTSYGLLAFRAFSEVEQGLANETLLREREEYLREVLAELSEAFRVATVQFNVAKVDFLKVLQQQGRVISAKVDLLSLRDQRLQQRVDLHLALGGSFEE